MVNFGCMEYGEKKYYDRTKYVYSTVWFLTTVSSTQCSGHFLKCKKYLDNSDFLLYIKSIVWIMQLNILFLVSC